MSPSPDDSNLALFQMTNPSRWMATQAVIFLSTLFGSTRHYMMKGVPPFLQLISLPSKFPPDFSAPESLAITVESVPGLLKNSRCLSDDFGLIVAGWFLKIC